MTAAQPDPFDDPMVANAQTLLLGIGALLNGNQAGECTTALGIAIARVICTAPPDARMLIVDRVCDILRSQVRESLQ